ncbi:SGNH/GDSL hydrolase family protein [Microbulbifer sp. GL-2]|uniref:SGNH/GDSL hydrolase family protein n=1 Tax=Microbulbifer sp. GL-2 TaxID=2591606 RepID=UPI0011658C9E|nr:SGNH/GDSL hydrolase family protein [Microbulbifer sp. GL-2]BBM03922.1 hypothetical protein GL2_39960 [Microbulbifer sp. GL-2]
MSNYFLEVTRLHNDINALDAILAGGEDETVLVNGQTKDTISKAIKARFEQLQAQVQGRRAYTTKALMTADTGQPVNTLAEVWNDSEDNNGLYGWDGGTWVKSPYDIKAYVNAQQHIATEENASAQAVGLSAAELEYPVTEVAEADFRPMVPSWLPSVGLKGWAPVFRVSVARNISDIKLRLTGTNDMVKLHVRVIRRAVDSPNTGPTANNYSSDSVLVNTSYDLSSYDGVASGEWEEFSLGLQFTAIPGYYYFVEYTCDTAAALNAPIGAQSGWTRAPFESSTDAQLAGFYQKVDGNWIAYKPGNNKCLGLVVLTSGAEANVLADAGRNGVATQKIRSALGLGNRAAISADSLNEAERVNINSWKGADFTGWMTFRAFDKTAYVDALRCTLNNANSTNSPDANLDTRYVRIEIFEDAPGVMTLSNFYQRPRYYKREHPVALSSAGVDIELPLGITFKEGREYAITLTGLDIHRQRSGLGIAGAMHPDILSGDRRLGGYQLDDHSEMTFALPNSNFMPQIETVALKPYVTKEKLDQITSGMALVGVPVYERPRAGLGWQHETNDGRFFDRWAVGYQPLATTKVDELEFLTSGMASLPGFNFRIYRRPDSLDLNSTPGSLEEDEVFFEKDFKNADFAAPDDGWFELSINTDDVGELEAGYLYIFAFDTEAYPGYGIGMGRSTDEYSNDDIWQRGWYGVSNSTTWNPIAGTSSIGFRVMVNRYQMAGQEPIAPTHTEVRVGQSKVSGVTVTLTGLELQRLNLPIKLTSTELVLRQPIKTFAKTETYSLLYDIDQRLFYHPGAYLPYRFIRNVSIVRTSDNQPLVEGVDYSVWYDGGKVQGLQDVPAFDVEITYDGYDSRYDLIEYDPFTGAVSVKEGTSRSYDPEEYIPTPSTDKRPLYLAYVYGNNCELIPLYPWEYGLFEGNEREVLRRSAFNRRALQKTLGKLRKGNPLTFAGYGDSITAQGGGTWQTPNGTTRDTESYYGDYPQDTKDLWPRYDHGDGAGQVHQHMGWNWYLKAQLEEAFGSLVSYDNWGIGGTTSADHTDPDGVRHGGLHPDRLNTMLATSPDLVVIGFGMNEIGQSNTSTNVAEIARQCKAAGADVIIMGCPRISSIGGRASLDSWRTTNDRLWLAAQETGSAFVSTTYLADNERLGGIALSPLSMCNANRFNHPGPYELRKYGQALAELFL